MKINDPVGLAETIKELDDVKKENEGLQDENKSLLSEKEALEAENGALKDSLQAKEQEVADEKAKVEKKTTELAELGEQVATLTGTVKNLGAEIAGLKLAAEEAKAEAAKAEEEAEDVKDQFALVAEHLDVGGVAADPIEVPAVDSQRTNSKQDTIDQYYRLKGSSSPKDRALATKMLNTNPIVKEHVLNKLSEGVAESNVADRTAPGRKPISEADKETYAEYKRLSEIRNELSEKARNNKNPEIRAQRAQAQLAVQRFYNAHTEVIMACAGAEALGIE